MQLLYLSKRSHPDIYILVSSLFTRVREPYNDGYKKLLSLMKYIQGTIGLSLILSIYKSGSIHWYVDASFTVHKDMRIHNYGFITMVTGGAYIQSREKKLNIKSLTEAKLFGVNNFLTRVIWTRYFLKEQVYEIHDNVIYQDN